MTDWKFTESMVDILKHMIGKRFCSYEKDRVANDQAYCVLRINLDDGSVLLKNEEEEIPMLSDEIISEEAARFSCSEVDKSSIYEPRLDNVGIIKCDINEIIKNVQIISDTIINDQADMDIAIDMAVVIKTEKNIYTFSKSETWFDEMIYINVNKSFDEICPINKVIEMWNNDGELKVEVKREITNL